MVFQTSPEFAVSIPHSSVPLLLQPEHGGDVEVPCVVEEVVVCEAAMQEDDSVKKDKHHVHAGGRLVVSLMFD